MADQDAEARPRAPSGPRRRASSSGSTTARTAQGFNDDGYPAHVRRAGHRRHAAAADQRRLGSQRRRVDARRQADPLQRRCAWRTPSTSGASRRSTRSTSTRGAITQLTTRKGPDGNPTVSPDGKLVAYTGNDWSTRHVDRQQALRDEHRRLQSAPGVGRLGSLAAERARGRPTAPACTSPRRIRASQNLYFLPLAGSRADEVQPVTKGTHMLTTTEHRRRARPSASLTSLAAAAATSSSSTSTTPRQIKQLTAVNDDILAGQEARRGQGDLVHVAPTA